MEAAGTSETMVDFYQTTQCNKPEDGHLHASSVIIYLHVIRLSITNGMCKYLLNGLKSLPTVPKRQMELYKGGVGPFPGFSMNTTRAWWQEGLR